MFKCVYIVVCFDVYVYDNVFSFSAEKFAMKCPVLRSLNHGQVAVTTDAVWVATYTCDRGYTLHGNRHRYCQENGKWTGSDPYCSPGTVRTSSIPSLL